MVAEHTLETGDAEGCSVCTATACACKYTSACISHCSMPITILVEAC